MRASRILLLLAILAGGAAIEIAWHARAEIGIGPTGWRVLSGRFHGPSHRFESEERRELGERRRIRVANEFGDVSVATGPPGEVSAVLRKRIYLPGEQEARRFAERVELVWREESERLELTTNRGRLSRDERDVGFETDLELRVPGDTRLEIENRYGAVRVSDVASLEASTSDAALHAERVAGPVALVNSGGPVTALEIAGDLKLSARHGSVELAGVTGAVDGQVHHGDVRASRTGPLKLELRHGDLDAEELTGDLAVRGSRAGVRASAVAGAVEIETSDRDVTLERVTGAAAVRSRHGDLELRGIGGGLRVEVSDGDADVEDVTGTAELELRRGSLRGRGIEGAVRIGISGHDVSLQDFSGPLSVRAQRADVSLEPRRPLAEPVEVSCERGSIHVELPAGAGLELQAESERGRVDVDVAGFETARSSERAVTGRVGEGGPLVSLRSSHGDVTVTSVDAPAR